MAGLPTPTHKGGHRLPILGQGALRSGELTAVLARDVFEALPGGVDRGQEERWNAFRLAYHEAHQLSGPEGFPLQLDFELNSTCQMKCSFCVHGQRVVEKRELPFETFARAIDEGASHGLCSVKLNYINEPLLRKDLARFIRYAKSRGILNVYFATNGLLLSRDRAAELIDAGLSKIMVSLDAVSSGTFRVMRASDKLHQIESNIHGLLALRKELGVSHPAIRVNFVRTAHNAHEADAFIARWTGVADAIGFQTQVRRPGVDDDLLRAIPEGDEAPFRCSFPSKLLVVDASGDILPCCTFSGRELAIGNISSMTLEAAWKSAKMRTLKTLHRDGQGMTNATCAHCVGAA